MFDRVLNKVPIAEMLYFTVFLSFQKIQALNE